MSCVLSCKPANGSSVENSVTSCDEDYIPHADSSLSISPHFRDTEHVCCEGRRESAKATAQLCNEYAQSERIVYRRESRFSHRIIHGQGAVRLCIGSRNLLGVSMPKHTIDTTSFRNSTPHPTSGQGRDTNFLVRHADHVHASNKVHVRGSTPGRAPTKYSR